MFPGINIQFQNGQLDQVAESPDGVSGLLASATAVGLTFLLNTAYQLKGMADVAALGIVNDVNNYVLYKALSEFYAEAGEGTELWLMGFAKTTKVSDWFKPEALTGKAPVEKLLDSANGKPMFVWTAFSPSGDYVVELEDGVDEDVWLAATQAQSLSEDYTAKKYAPFFSIIEGYAFSGVKVDLADLTQKSHNRVMIMLGDTETRTGVPASKGAATGILAGRLAKSQVMVNPGKVADGPLSNLKAYVLDTPVEQYDCEALNDKGYVTFRTHAMKSGYYFADGPLACELSDDYHFVTHRRTIDKAYRVAYLALLDYLLDENMLTDEGTIDPIYVKVIENAVESSIYDQMTRNNELSFDASNAKDRGVICKVDLTNNVASTSKLKLTKLQVRARGHNRYIDVPLGFVPVNIQ